jgi:hypothetical protein
MTFPTNPTERDAYILQRVREGEFSLDWAPIELEEDGFKVILYVQADALKIEGVRINVTAEMSQQIADMTGAVLLTPKVADLIYHFAAFRIEPHPQTWNNTTQGMIDHSKAIDAALAAYTTYGMANTPLIGVTGKYWTLSNTLLGSDGKPRIAQGFPVAMNYGWHFLGGSSFKGIPGYECVSHLRDPSTKEVYHVIQDAATAHNSKHGDYSQTHRSMADVLIVNGENMATVDALRHPVIGKMLSHEGPLHVVRQPGVPEPKEKVIIMPEITITASAEIVPAGGG